MTVVDDNWILNADIDIVKETECFYNFEKMIDRVQDNILKLLEDSLMFNTTDSIGEDLNSDGDLQILTEKNKQLRHDIDMKLKDLEKQQNKYANYKKDQKLLSQEIKETHEAFLMAKKSYKRFLKIYFTIESTKNGKQAVFVQFFTEAKKDSGNYSVHLQRDIKSRHYELLGTVPKLNFHKEFERRLQETNDVPGLLCCIRQAFLKIKGNKKR